MRAATKGVNSKAQCKGVTRGLRDTTMTAPALQGYLAEAQEGVG